MNRQESNRKHSTNPRASHVAQEGRRDFQPLLRRIGTDLKRCASLSHYAREPLFRTGSLVDFLLRQFGIGFEFRVVSQKCFLSRFRLLYLGL